MPEIPAIRVWKEPRCPLQIEYRADVPNHLCRLAIDGLLALPRVGLGVGGLLLGSHDSQGITIAGFVPIPCSHAMGPSFLLTPEETEVSRGTTSQLSIVGCYCSKTTGARDLSDNGLIFFRDFCPESWQIMLRIKPSTVEDSRLALCFRDQSGTVICGDERPLSDDSEPEITPESDQNPPELLEEKGRGRTGPVVVAVVAAAALLAAGAIALLLHLI